MFKNYSGNTKAFAAVLCAGDAKEKARGLLGQFAARGLNLCIEDGSRSCKGKTTRAFATIALLSEGFAKSRELREALFAADSAGRAIIPVHTDGAVQSDDINRILFARNALFAENYANDEELADRIFNGSVLEHPFITDAQKKARRKTAGCIAAAAAAAAAAAGILLSGMLKQNRPEPQPEPAPADFLEANGITGEDLKNITGVLLLGDKLYYSTVDEDISLNIYDYANDAESPEDDKIYCWYSHEDGSRIETAHYDNLEFLEKLPWLREFHLYSVDVPELPDLSGMKHLHTVCVADCSITDISGIAGTNVKFFENSRTPVADYSPLTECPLLTQVHIDLHGVSDTDFSGFAPPNLTFLNLRNGSYPLKEIDLSGIAGCEKLADATLINLPLKNLDFLENKSHLNRLDLDELYDITDISVLGTCPALHTVHLGLENLHDASPLGSLKSVDELFIHCPVGNLDFLKEMPARFSFTLHFSDGIDDYSGLAAVKSFNYLHCNITGKDYGVVKEYIKGKKAGTAEIVNARNIDFSALPDAGIIYFCDCAVESLEDLEDNDSTMGIELENCQYLRSLEGVENLSLLRKATVDNCPRITDWSALYGKEYEWLKITGMFTMPDFSQLEFSEGCELILGAPAETDSLDFLEGITESSARIKFALIDISGMKGITDLSPLRRLNGSLLKVSPQLADQAQQLVENGIFDEYIADYSEGFWDEIHIEILSLEDLETLPDVLLAKAEYVEMCGDTMDKGCRYLVTENGRAYFTDENGSNLGYVGESPLNDLTPFAKLTGLREICLCFQQNLVSLEGLQNLQQLEKFNIENSNRLEDITALFALGGVRTIDIHNTSVTSIDGIENMYSLEEADLGWNDDLRDITPLAKLPNLRTVYVSQDMEEAIASLDGQDYDFELEIYG